jgi:hypothetical protein
MLNAIKALIWKVLVVAVVKFYFGILGDFSSASAIYEVVVVLVVVMEEIDK